jgi:1-acyl-sn-glycerol-3-phosphate acyltransferase
MAAIRSLAFYVAFYLGSVAFVLVAVIVNAIAPRHLRPVPDTWSRYHRWCLRLAGIRVRQVGKPVAGPALYAIKHESFFDAIDLPNWLDFPVPFGKRELYRIPGWGRAARAYGSIPVARDEGAKALREMLAEAKRYAATGRPLAIFPEGTRVPHGTVAPLQSGFAGIYKLLGLPVVPVAIDSGPYYQRWIKHPGAITIQIGEPIPPGLPRPEIEARVTEALNALNPA